MFLDTDALVLREVRYKEADRILTLYSASQGKITVRARGALRKNSKLTAATQQLTYTDFTLFSNKDRWSVNEAVVKEDFHGLREDITALALGSYIAECVEAVSVENEPEEGVLQLILNTLYAISHRLYPQRKIKAAFELRLMGLLGYEPNLECCSVCGAELPEAPVFFVSEGMIRCRSCSGAGKGPRFPLGEEALAAARYVLHAPAKRLYSFTVSDEALKALSAVAEAWLLQNTDRNFGTLEYYHSLMKYMVEVT